MTELMIRASEVSKTFGKVTALDRVSVEVPQGTVLGLLGHNGAGKTTLVNILSTMFPPSSGTASVAGYDVVAQPTEVRRRIGLTGQFASVDEDLTGTENLVLIARLLGAGRRAARQRAAELMETFDLADAAGRAVKTYSGGMRRRLDLASSLVGQPRMVFLDEPTTGLDPSSRVGMWEVVEGLVAGGTTILLTTQYLDEADRLADSITVLSKGRVVAQGTAAQLKAEVGQRTVAVSLEPGTDPWHAVEAIRRGGKLPTFDPERNSISVPVLASKELVTVVRALDEAGIEPAGLALTEPTLDDVYLALTHSSPSAA
ncbi:MULTISPECIES: ATP-binding cassette domain-containing protein [unclassified Crossiella]|uniref:ATP-binding cassette domain-containing protein n=1 Tax=unclassified Crossiella TaxID=2620835 RepID=UPI001FFF10AC|nr:MULTISPECIES: ATP-binding cassette domain-containing protein [unclassified Crossiella]MCK2241220.1 ATP-binding cassette domain-containing protein [Crossiella sp. S99.2]MCK2253636.1 ATP-binding cassette domain-containing protein [Crossiella sp. S99.1]